jgi:hypothetical protein
MDVDISESENRLENTCCMSIHFLDSIERTLTHIACECWELLYADHTRISDDEEIQLIIDPVQEHECEKYYPIQCHASPVEPTADDIYDGRLISQEKYRRYQQYYHIEKMEHEYNPVTMEGQDYMFVFAEEGDVFFVDHVICGSLR